MLNATDILLEKVNDELYSSRLGKLIEHIVSIKNQIGTAV